MDETGVIFLLENSTDYLFTLDQEFRAAKLNNPLRVARYGNEAILYLKGVGIYGDRKRYPLPQLIIIDLSVPDGSALMVLGWLRKQPGLSQVPIMVLVHPAQTRYLQEAMDIGANAYYVPRDDFRGLAEMIKSIQMTAKQSDSESPEFSRDSGLM